VDFASCPTISNVRECANVCVRNVKYQGCKTQFKNTGIFAMRSGNFNSAVTGCITFPRPVAYPLTRLMPGATETNLFKRAGHTDTKLGQGEKDAVSDVARDGYEALMAGKDHLVAGNLSIIRKRIDHGP
jgi:hypothetical protein